MSERTVAGLRTRLEVARELFAGMPRAGRGVPGPPDEKTGERWDRGNVLGHVAELLPFWTAQARNVRAGAREFGRGEEGYRRRREGIDAGGRLGEEELHRQIQAGIAGLDGFLAELDDADLARRATYRARSGDREMELGEVLDELLVGHVEEHATQLAQLSPGG